MGFTSGNYGYKVCDVDVPAQKKPVDGLDKDGTHLGEIYIRWISDSRPETSSSDLRRSIEDYTPGALRRGTKDMRNHGSCRWLGLRKRYMKKPRLMFPAFSASLTAVSDPTYKLAANEVYVVQDGKPYIGPLTMWRYPLHTITDIVNLVAVEPPPGLLYDSCIVLSRDGPINTRCAGGDLDGDLNCITFFNEPVTLVGQTEADVLLYNVDRFEQEVKDMLPKIETAFRSQELMERFDEYTDHAMKLSTRNIRGALCAMAERAAVPALLCNDPLRDGTLANSQRMVSLRIRC